MAEEQKHCPNNIIRLPTLVHERTASPSHVNTPR